MGLYPIYSTVYQVSGPGLYARNFVKWISRVEQMVQNIYKLYCWYMYLYRLELFVYILPPTLSPLSPWWRLFLLNKAKSPVFSVWTAGWHYHFRVYMLLVTDTQVESFAWKLTNMNMAT